MIIKTSQEDTKEKGFRLTEEKTIKQFEKEAAATRKGSRKETLPFHEIKN